VAEELADLLAAHLLRMPLVVEEDEAADPIHIGVLGSHAVVADADRIPHLVEQPRLLRHGPPLGGSE